MLKDLSKFVTISELGLCHWFSLCTGQYQKLFKEGTVISRQQGAGRMSITDEKCEEQKLACVVLSTD